MTTLQTELNHKIIDEQFDVNNIATYQLAFVLGKNNLRVAITDKTTNRCLFLEDYRFLAATSTTQLLESLEELYNSHTLLQAGYWGSVKIAFKDKKYVFLPQDLVDENHLKDYLWYAEGNVPLQEQVLHYTHASNATNIFSIENEILQWFKKKYPTQQVVPIHQVSAFIEGIAQKNTNNATEMHLYVEEDNFTLVAMVNQTMHFCNTFSYHTPQDFLYYTILTINQLGFTPEASKIYLYGEISADSAVYNLLYKYIKEVKFGQRPTGMFFSYVFDEVLEHRYFELYALHFFN